MTSQATYSHLPSAERPLISEIRMSRLRYPRATVLAMILLAAVFLLFGMIASALEPGHTPVPTSAEGIAMIVSNWLFSW